jgi:hypothetical protein
MIVIGFIDGGKQSAGGGQDEEGSSIAIAADMEETKRGQQH